MKRNEINILLNIYNPFIRFSGKCTMISNIDEFPTNDKLLKTLYHHFDFGFVQSCKKFNITNIPQEIVNMITQYLNVNICFNDVKTFYKDCFYRDLYILEQDTDLEYLESKTRKDYIYSNIRFTIIDLIYKKIDKK